MLVPSASGGEGRRCPDDADQPVGGQARNSGSVGSEQGELERARHGDEGALVRLLEAESVELRWAVDGAFGSWLRSLACNAVRDAIRALEADKRGGSLRLWQVGTDAARGIFAPGGSVLDGDAGGGLVKGDVASVTPTQRYPASDVRVLCLAKTVDGEGFASGARDGILRA